MDRRHNSSFGLGLRSSSADDLACAHASSAPSSSRSQLAASGANLNLLDEVEEVKESPPGELAAQRDCWRQAWGTQTSQTWDAGSVTASFEISARPGSRLV